MLHPTLLVFLACCANFGAHALKFCTWADKPSQYKPPGLTDHSASIFDPNVASQIDLQKPLQSTEKEQSVVSLLHKNQQFRSYRPHYLHSYSYPEPITPHIYFGQLNSMNSYVFLVKDNETLANTSVSNEIFYVNGQQQYGDKGILFQPTNLRLNSHNLNFALVAQIQNLSETPAPTKLSLYNFGYFYGIICELASKYIKSFILYISHEGSKPVNLNDNHPEFALQIKNLSELSNKLNWKYAHEPQKIKKERVIKLSADPQTPNVFATLVVAIKYSSLEAAQQFKVALRQFPYRDKLAEEEVTNFETVQEALAAISAININSYQFKFQLVKSWSPDSCEVRAEKQLLKGLSYEFGNLVLKNGSQPIPNSHKELFSFSPSRKRFPWGFLWDDGFHCEVAVRNEPELALKVIKSWLDTMHESGWIPREQNRGEQRVFLCNCPLFMSKDIRDGNPPTLLLGLNFLARSKVLNSDNFQARYWEKLKSWYNWFMLTQTEAKDSYIFRWYDSIPNQGSFNSGMDDFPRLKQTVGHVDCQAWMYFFATTMAIIRDSLEIIGGSFLSDADKIKKMLLSQFIDPKTKTLQDFNKSNDFNPHFGYPSLLPIAFGMVEPEHEAYASTIRKLKEELDSGFGITSISIRDSEYLNENAYWRGPVWININYLVLRGLHMFYKKENELYKKLRRDIINTVCIQEGKRGYFYENYIKGVGSFSYPFTGWTALISIIIRENF